MRRELRYFDIYPKVVRAGEESEITIRYLERRFLPPEGTQVRLQLIPTRESAEMAADEGYPTLTAPVCGRVVRFRHLFEREQEYYVRLYTENEQFIRLSVYALEDDLYGLTPLRGDLHVHTTYSDGNESPELTAALYRMHGFDFMVVSDHDNYNGSMAAIAFYRDVKTGLCIVPGEEVHPVDNHIHTVNFGGSFSVCKLMEYEPDRYRREVDELLKTLEIPAGVNAREYASCHWVYGKIREGGGLSIFAHPHWIVDAYHVPDAMTAALFRSAAFDAFELVGGMCQAENNMQLALYYEHLAQTGGNPGFAIVGSSDSHGAVREDYCGSSYAGRDYNAHGFGEFYSYVFARGNTREDIIHAVRSGNSVAASQYSGEHPQFHGRYRLAAYSLFLHSEYFPLHDELCYEEGRLMMALAGGDEQAKTELKRLDGRVARLTARYLGDRD